MAASISDATRLTAEQIEDLRTCARMASGPFIDPRALHRVDRASFHADWATAILGREYPGIRWARPWEITLLDLALDAEPDRPTPAAELARQEQARREFEAERQATAEAYLAKLDAWHQLRDRLPIPVTVGHNWTIGHWESGHVAGKDHIVAQAELAVGRLRRTKHQVLCETPGKNRSGGRRNPDPLRGVDREDDGEDRIPTCAACLKVAERIASPADPDV